jgi:hypothetical protein
MSPSSDTDFCEFAYRIPVSGSNEPPGQFVPPPADAITRVRPVTRSNT